MSFSKDTVKIFKDFIFDVQIGMGKSCEDFSATGNTQNLRKMKMGCFRGEMALFLRNILIETTPNLRINTLELQRKIVYNVSV